MTEDTADHPVYLDEAAAAVHVSRRTLYNWMAEGLLPFTVAGRRSRRVKLSDVQRIKAMTPTERWQLDEPLLHDQ